VGGLKSASGSQRVCSVLLCPALRPPNARPRRRAFAMTTSLQSTALALHERLLAGDPRAPSEIFELFETHLSAVVRSTVPKLVDPADVNAAVADTLLRYFRALSLYDPARSTLLTWLCNQARYNALSQVRNYSRRLSGLAWAQTALENECNAVASARPGTRNDQLNTSAFNLFQLVAGGYLNEQEVRERLFAAAEASGLVDDDGPQAVEATINSGAQAGRAQPRLQPPPPPQPSSAPQSQQQSPQPQPQPQPSPSPSTPVIRLVEGQLPRAVDEAEAALIANGRRHIYQRGDLLVRPIKPKLKAADDRDTVGWQLTPITKPYMIDTFTRIARFERFDARLGKYLAKNCPDKVAELFIARGGHWKVPVLLSIVNAPFLRRDSSLCERPGYDQASALLFNPEKQTFPPIPLSPTLQDARDALKYLDETLLEEFPFVEKIDRSVALSAILTALDRRAMATAPLHAFTSPVAGTGKSMLVDLASILASAEFAPVIAQGEDEREMEKRLGASLIAGDQIISLDNCDREVSSSFLCQALTQQRLKIRLLGFSRHVDVPITATFFATGNNLVIASDLTRRTLLCQLDAGMERPELRSFKRNVLETARAERGPLVAAALTVLRAWHLARTAIGIEPLGSFEEWSFRIRQPLMWLDRIDPCESITTVRESDPSRSLLITVLEQWKLCLGFAGTHTIKQVIERALVDQDFFNAIVPVASTSQGTISNQRLGRWLSKNEGKIANGLKLQRAGLVNGFPLWQVVRE
jgi:DNA-directed RNA polymerase specialized sigma24 family protein